MSVESVMKHRIPSDGELIAEAINRQTTALEIQLSELNDEITDIKEHVGMISIHLIEIKNSI